MKNVMGAVVQGALDKGQSSFRALITYLASLQSQKTRLAFVILLSYCGRKPLIVLAAFGVGVSAWLLVAGIGGRSGNGHAQSPSHDKHIRGIFSPTPAQWSTFTIVPVVQRVFRSEHVTEGKIAVNEDRSTLIFSPYSGRVTKLLVKPGDTVERGQPLSSWKPQTWCRYKMISSPRSRQRTRRAPS